MKNTMKTSALSKCDLNSFPVLCVIIFLDIKLHSVGIKVILMVWQCCLEHVWFKDSTLAALPPLLWAIWTPLVPCAPMPRWTRMSAWVSSIHGVRPQGDGHTADGSQRGAKVTSSSLHPMEPAAYFTATGLCERVCVWRACVSRFSPFNNENWQERN